MILKDKICLYSERIIVFGILCLFSTVLAIGAEKTKPVGVLFKEDIRSLEITRKQTELPQTKEKLTDNPVKKDIRKLDYPETAGKISSVRFFFPGVPGVQYLGFIAAQKLGYYKEAGLPEVQLLWMNEYQNPCELLMLGQVDFISTWMIEGYLACAAGHQIVAISQTAQRSSCGICVQKRPGEDISDIKQLEGKKVGIWCRNEAVPRFFFEHENIHPEFIVQNPASVFLMKKGVLDALFYSSYSTKVYAEVYQKRDAFNFFDFSAYGINIPEDTIFCRRSFLKRFPDISEKFIRTSWKGWKYVVENPQEAIQMLREQRIRFSLSVDTVLLQKQLQAWMGIMMWNNDLDQNGHCSKDGFALMRLGLIKHGTLNKDAPFYEDFFYNILDPEERVRLKKMKTENF